MIHVYSTYRNLRTRAQLHGLCFHGLYLEPLALFGSWWHYLFCILIDLKQTKHFTNTDLEHREFQVIDDDNNDDDNGWWCMIGITHIKPIITHVYAYTLEHNVYVWYSSYVCLTMLQCEDIALRIIWGWAFGRFRNYDTQRCHIKRTNIISRMKFWGIEKYEW